MNVLHRPYKLLVTGRSGSGKTTYWLRSLLGFKTRTTFVFDHEAELSHRLGVKPHVTSQDLGQGAFDGWAIFDPATLFPGDLESAFRFFLDFAFTTSQRLPGRKVFACDELQKLVGTSGIPWELANVLETGRRYGLDFAAVSQQPNLLHNRIRNQLTEVVTFHHVDATAIDWLEAAGFEADDIRALRPGQWLARNLTSGACASGEVF